MSRRRLAVAAAVAVAVIAAVAVLAAIGSRDEGAFRAPAGVDELAGRLDRAVPDALVEAHVPGASVAVVRRGRVAWSRGYGVADARTGRPVTADTRFQVGSLSKPVTAWAVTGRSGLASDTPVVDLLERDRKSTRLNSSHVAISYAVFCLKKKKTNTQEKITGETKNSSKYC